jgi:hypothetical protein
VDDGNVSMELKFLLILPNNTGHGRQVVEKGVMEGYLDGLEGGVMRVDGRPMRVAVGDVVVFTVEEFFDEANKVASDAWARGVTEPVVEVFAVPQMAGG